MRTYAIVFALLTLVVVPINAQTNACPPIDCPGDMHYANMEIALASGSSPVRMTVSSEGWWSDMPAVTLNAGKQKGGDKGQVKVIAALPVRPTGVMYVGVRGDGVVMYYADKELRMAIAKPFLQILSTMQELTQQSNPKKEN